MSRFIDGSEPYLFWLRGQGRNIDFRPQEETLEAVIRTSRALDCPRNGQDLIVGDGFSDAWGVERRLPLLRRIANRLATGLIEALQAFHEGRCHRKEHHGGCGNVP
jgi:hypothetical protein